MATSFDRSAVQEFFETQFGCSDADQLKSKADLVEEFCPDADALDELSRCVFLDTSAQYERAMWALFQGIGDLQRGRTTWAAVKFYYSVFYLLRTEMHLNGLSPVRCGKVFLVSANAGATARRFNNKQHGDHALAIEVAKKELSGTDIMMSSKIADMDVYSWLKGVREAVQYRMRVMPELNGTQVFLPFEEQSLGDQLLTYLYDSDPYYCFDPDYAALAIPVTRFRLTSENLKNAGVRCHMSAKRKLEELRRTEHCADLFDRCCLGAIAD